jgi:hypothetical protein
MVFVPGEENFAGGFIWSYEGGRSSEISKAALVSCPPPAPRL